MKPLFAMTANAVLVTLCSIGPAHAFNPQPDPPGRFGMVGIVYGQTARLNVVAVAATSGDLSPGPCRVALGFFDSAGRPLGEPAQVLLMPGNAGYLDLPAVQLSVDDRTLRAQVRPLAQVLPNARGEKACNGVAATVEVFDMTGRTSVLYTDPNILQGYVDPGI